MNAHKWQWLHTPAAQGVIVDGYGFVVIKGLTKAQAQEIVRQHNCLIRQLGDVVEEGAQLIDEAMRTHIYNEDNGEKPEADCGYARHIRTVAELKGEEL